MVNDSREALQAKCFGDVEGAGITIEWDSLVLQPSLEDVESMNMDNPIIGLNFGDICNALKQDVKSHENKERAWKEAEAVRGQYFARHE